MSRLSGFLSHSEVLIFGTGRAPLRQTNHEVKLKSSRNESRKDWQTRFLVGVYRVSLMWQPKLIHWKKLISGMVYFFSKKNLNSKVCFTYEEIFNKKCYDSANKSYGHSIGMLTIAKNMRRKFCGLHYTGNHGVMHTIQVCIYKWEISTRHFPVVYIKLLYQCVHSSSWFIDKHVLLSCVLLGS